MDRNPPWWWPTVIAAAVLPVAVAIVALVSAQGPDDAAIGTPANATSTADPSGSPGAQPGSSSSVDTDVDAPPKVKDDRRVSFATSDKLPDGGTLYDAGRSASGMAVKGGVLTHGTSVSANATGYLQVKLGADVQKIGFRVSFPAESVGKKTGAAVTAWEKSVEAARADVPKTGMRLVVFAGSWQLVLLDPDKTVLGGETYEASHGAARFSIVRSGDEIWVSSPGSETAHFTDPRIAALAGVWASWELFETKPGISPASISRVWAG